MSHSNQDKFAVISRKLSSAIDNFLRERNIKNYMLFALTSSILSFLLRDVHFMIAHGKKVYEVKRRFSFLEGSIAKSYIIVFLLLIINSIIQKILYILNNHRIKKGRGCVSFIVWDSEIRYKSKKSKKDLYFENINAIYKRLGNVNKQLFFVSHGDIFTSYVKKDSLKHYLTLIKSGIPTLIGYDFPIITKSIILAYLYEKELKKLSKESRVFALVYRNSNPPRLVSFLVGFLSAKKLVEMYRPKVFVLTNEGNIFIRGFIVGLKEEGVKSIALQHGVIHPQHFSYYHLPSEFRLKINSLPNKTLVYGRYYKRVLVKLGYRPDQIIIAGAPRYDEYFKETSRSRIKMHIKKKFGIHDDSLVFAIFTQPLGEETIHYVKMLIDTMIKLKRKKGIENAIVFLKPHPREFANKGVISIYRSMVDRLKENGINSHFIEFGELTSLDLLLITSLAFSFSSTVLIEALLLGAIPVSLKPSGVDYIEYMRDKGCLVEAESNESIEKIISKFSIAKESFEKKCAGIAEEFLANKGNSTKFVVSFILGFF